MSDHNKIEKGDNVSRQNAQQDSTYVNSNSTPPPIAEIKSFDRENGTVTYTGRDGNTYTVDQNKLEQ